MERLRRRRSEPTPPGPPGWAPLRHAAAGAAAEGDVQFIWGSDNDTLTLAGMSVADVYGLLREPYNIAPGVAALVNGRRVGGNQRLATGDTLEFTRPAGEKGAL